MTKTALTLNAMMLIADQMEDLEVQLDFVRRTSNSESLIAKLQDHVIACGKRLEAAWDAWNDAMQSERLAQIYQ